MGKEYTEEAPSEGCGCACAFTSALLARWYVYSRAHIQEHMRRIDSRHSFRPQIVPLFLSLALRLKRTMCDEDIYMHA